jgi:hypothetical protein
LGRCPKTKNPLDFHLRGFWEINFYLFTLFSKTPSIKRI